MTADPGFVSSSGLVAVGLSVDSVSAVSRRPRLDSDCVSGTPDRGHGSGCFSRLPAAYVERAYRTSIGSAQIGFNLHKCSGFFGGQVQTGRYPGVRCAHNRSRRDLLVWPGARCAGAKAGRRGWVVSFDVFPGLWLDPAALQNGDTRQLRTIVDLGCATPGHSAFRALLASRRCQS
jgi:hypothetical protein